VVPCLVLINLPRTTYHADGLQQLLAKYRYTSTPAILYGIQELLVSENNEGSTRQTLSQLYIGLDDVGVGCTA